MPLSRRSWQQRTEGPVDIPRPQRSRGTAAKSAPRFGLQQIHEDASRWCEEDRFHDEVEAQQSVGGAD